jgi:glycerophosphoryl diester phosphodiesterase
MKRLKTALLLTLSICAVGGCASTVEVSKEAGQNITVIAHRGASGHAPENTLAAFRLATESGADYFELDCRLTKDDAVVILHDPDLDRIAGSKVEVANLTLAEVQAFNAGSWLSKAFATERVPTLLESLDVATPDCGVYVEIKGEAGDGPASATLVAATQGQATMSDELRQSLLSLAGQQPTRSPQLTRECIDDIRKRGMEKRVVIQSFSPLICFIARCEAPDIRTELLLSDNKDDPAHFDRLVEFALLIGVEGINVSKGSLTPERLARIKGAGKTVAVYTLNEANEMASFINMGVDAIITDYPKECHDQFRASH